MGIQAWIAGTARERLQRFVRYDIPTLSILRRGGEPRWTIVLRLRQSRVSGF